MIGEEAIWGVTPRDLAQLIHRIWMKVDTLMMTPFEHRIGGARISVERRREDRCDVSYYEIELSSGSVGFWSQTKEARGFGLEPGAGLQHCYRWLRNPTQEQIAEIKLIL